MTTQDQYTSTLRRAEETAADAVGSLTKDLQNAFGQSKGFGDPSALIDQVFDFWEHTLAVQRDFAKKLANLTGAARETVRTQVEAAGDTVRSQVESTKEAARDQLAARYEELTKPELQDLLADRGLPKTGNVDELKSRLLEEGDK
jgi:hypothetical protein